MVITTQNISQGYFVSQGPSIFEQEVSRDSLSAGAGLRDNPLGYYLCLAFIYRGQSPACWIEKETGGRQKAKGTSNSKRCL